VVEGGVRAFGTPIVLHFFCAVLLLAPILTIPRQTVTSLALCVGAAAIAGLALSTWLVMQARRQRSYGPVLSDWIWHVAMPWVACATVEVAAAVRPENPIATSNRPRDESPRWGVHRSRRAGAEREAR
jgi:hypothetical protein